MSSLLALIGVPSTTVQLFTTVFLSVLIGAMPFLIVAALASAAIELYVQPGVVARWLPRRLSRALFVAPLAGMAIPMCECGIVPVAGRLIRKGVPVPVAITFMLANPVLNPLVIYSTWLAFPYQREIVWLRLGLSYVVAILVGLLVAALFRGRALAGPAHGAGGAHGLGDPRRHRHHVHAADHQHSAVHDGGAEVTDARPSARLAAMIDHAAVEFVEIARYFVAGAFLAALAQTWISRETLVAVGGGPVSSVPVLMGFAYLLSICSEADAFVAATMSGTFSLGAITAFLVMGPMIDIKNTLMMRAVFHRPLVVFLHVAIIGLNLIAGVGLNLLWWRLMYPVGV